VLPYPDLDRDRDPDRDCDRDWDLNCDRRDPVRDPDIDRNRDPVRAPDSDRTGDQQLADHAPTQNGATTTTLAFSAKLYLGFIQRRHDPGDPPVQSTHQGRNRTDDHEYGYPYGVDTEPTRPAAVHALTMPVQKNDTSSL